MSSRARISAEREETRSDHDVPRRDYRPEGVERKGSLFATLKRTFKEYSEDNMSDWAASLTYYGLLAVFPALIALVAVVGLLGSPTSTTQSAGRNRRQARPQLSEDDLRRSDQIDHRTAKRRGDPADRRDRGGAVLRFELRRGFRPRIEHHLGDAGGEADVEAEAAADARDADHSGSADRDRAVARADRTGRYGCGKPAGDQQRAPCRSGTSPSGPSSCSS